MFRDLVIVVAVTALMGGGAQGFTTRLPIPTSVVSTSHPWSSGAVSPAQLLLAEHLRAPGTNALDAALPCPRHMTRLLLRRDDREDHENNTRLTMTSTNDELEGRGRHWLGNLRKFASNLDPQMIVIDMVAILVSGQLLGLLDVLNSSSFWFNGGWFQPVPLVPATLGTFVTQTISLSASWIMGSIVSKWMEVEDDPNIDENSSFSQRLFYDTSRTWVVFMAFRVALTTTLFTHTLDASALLLQAYVVGLCVPTFRWILYGRI